MKTDAQQLNVSAISVANTFLALAGHENKPITNMQLQKLVFLAQGYALALLKRPIFRDDIRAWQWGPVIPPLYKKLQKYGRDQVTETLDVKPGDIENLLENKKAMGIIRGVWNGYKDYTGGQLSSLTHEPNTPWKTTWDKQTFSVIPTDLIQEYYTKEIQSF